MNVHDNESQPEITPEPVDAQRVFESVVSELECLIQEAPLGVGSDLFELHGALLAYNLHGDASLLPTPPFGLSTRRLRERRVARVARAIIARVAGDQQAAMNLAADLIETHLHLIDPELRSAAAA